jgi:hypothetical protein
VGVYVQNGRLKGEPKKALRAIIESYGIPVRSREVHTRLRRPLR